MTTMGSRENGQGSETRRFCDNMRALENSQKDRKGENQ